MHQDAAVVRRSLLLIVGLMAVSTVLFVVGVPSSVEAKR